MSTTLVLGRPLSSWWRLANQFARYAVLGGCGALVDLAVFTVATHQAEVPAVPANVVSVLCGILTSFVLNARFTFSSGRGWRTGLARFATVGLVGLVASSVMIWSMVDLLGVQPLGAKLLVIPLIALGQFLANRRWTFGTAPSS